MKKEWNYENNQFTKLPAHLKHLPLFTRHFDFMPVPLNTGWIYTLAPPKITGFKIIYLHFFLNTVWAPYPLTVKKSLVNLLNLYLDCSKL